MTVDKTAHGARSNQPTNLERDEILKRMLRMKPKPHKAKPVKKSDASSAAAKR